MDLAGILTALAVLMTAFGGIITAITALRKARAETKDEEEHKCFERLKATRLEAEEAASALHEMRMDGHRDHEKERGRTPQSEGVEGT